MTSHDAYMVDPRIFDRPFQFSGWNRREERLRVDEARSVVLYSVCVFCRGSTIAPLHPQLSKMGNSICFKGETAKKNFLSTQRIIPRRPERPVSGFREARRGPPSTAGGGGGGRKALRHIQAIFQLPAPVKTTFSHFQVS